MRKITIEDIRNINELYLKYKTYAAVARETGFSPATVKRYIDINYSLISEDDIHRFDPNTEMPIDDNYLKLFEGLDNYGVLCVLSETEKNEIKELWKEMTV